MLIEDYDLEVEISPCRPGSEELVATVGLNVDITPVLPYLKCFRPKEVDMYKTILVPLDGSKRAEMILSHVQDLARHYDAKVILLQVVETMPPGAGLEHACMEPREEFEWRAKQTESYLAVLQEEFCEKGIEARTRVVCGSVVDAIIDTAEREGADLIAVGDQDRTGWSQGLYGCLATGLLHRVDWPLLFIRPQNGN
jgi:nucleotide-binding universal stress UspA family protein